MDFINIYGIITVIIMLAPNIIFALKNKEQKNKCKSKVINTLEQVGRYGSMLLMAFNIGFLGTGFKDQYVFTVWLIGTAVLLSAYLFCWALYLKNQKFIYTAYLTIIPGVIFIFSGLSQSHWLLVILGAVFAFSHVIVTYKNNTSI